MGIAPHQNKLYLVIRSISFAYDFFGATRAAGTLLRRALKISGLRLSVR